MGGHVPGSTDKDSHEDLFAIAETTTTFAVRAVATRHRRIETQEYPDDVGRREPMVDDYVLTRLEPLVLIAVGGFVGAALRHVVALGLPDAFPWGTLAANALGSFALGVVLYERHFADALSAETRLVVGTGFLSSFTTYSTFAAETVGLAGGQTPALAAANVAANYALGLVGVLCGRWLARWLS
jgi:CrcB protein